MSSIIFVTNVLVINLCFQVNFLRDQHCKTQSEFSDLPKITCIFWCLFRVLMPTSNANTQFQHTPPTATPNTHAQHPRPMPKSTSNSHTRQWHTQCLHPLGHDANAHTHIHTYTHTHAHTHSHAHLSVVTFYYYYYYYYSFILSYLYKNLLWLVIK